MIESGRALPVESPVMILAGLQAGFMRVIADVPPQVLILHRTADEVVEGLLLPELPFFVDCLIDPKRRVMKGLPADARRAIIKQTLTINVLPTSLPRPGSRLCHDETCKHAHSAF